MELHLDPTTLSRDIALREATHALEFLFDHRHFTYIVTALQQGVEQRLSDKLTQHSTLFRDMAEKMGELRVTNERIVAISQDINQLSRFDHTIGGIQFGTLHEQVPPAEDRKLREGDATAEL